MEGSGVSAAADGGDVRRKQRTVSSRRPRSNAQVFLVHDISHLSSTPSSDDANKTSPDDITSYDNSQREKEHNMNNPVMRPASSKVVEGTTSKKFKKDDKRFGNLEDLYRVDSLRNELSRHSNKKQHAVKSKRDSEGSLASRNRSSSNKVNKETQKIRSNSDDNNSDNIPDMESKPRKVKLKVGGVTCTINAKAGFTSDKLDSSSTKHSLSLNAPQHQQKHYIQENSSNILPREKRGDLQLTRLKKHSCDNVTEESLHGMQRDRIQDIAPMEPVRKSQRVQKRRLLDGIDSVNEDKDMTYEKSKTPTASTDNSDEVEEGAEDSSVFKHSFKVPKTSRNLYDVDDDFDLTGSKEKSKRTRSMGKSFDGEFMEEDELSSEDEPDFKRKKPKRDPIGLSTDGKSELLMTRQRALQSGKGAGGTSIEFPNGLPPAPSRAKVKLSEVEQQAKKAEAAQRRRMQVEKQARESQAEAIRKILGQDSSRKKKEYKRKDKDAESLVLMPSTIRWVMGPTGTVITFADDVGLPSILESKKCSYPPSREKCAGPSCTNSYKYRDSKSNLPLCSLQCYKAVRKSVQQVSTC